MLLLTYSVGVSQTEIDFRPEMTNPEYEEGDWVSTSMTRWVRNFAIGLEYIYFSTSGGLSRYNYFTDKWDYSWTTSNGLADNNILLVAYDETTNYIWCATEISLSCYFTTFRRWENYYFDDIGLIDDDRIISIGFDNSNVWIETAAGELVKGSKFGRIFEKVSGLTPNEFQAIKWFGYRAGNGGRLPFFTIGNGYFFDADGYITDMNLNRYDITTWTLDKWGNYWVTTLGLGVATAEERIEHLELLTNGLFLDNVSAFELDKKNRMLWIGGIGNVDGESGVTKWDMRTGRWEYFQSQYLYGLRNDQVNAIALDDNYVYFATEFGLAVYNQNYNEWKTLDKFSNLADNFVYDVEIDSEFVWAATAYGLSKITKATVLMDSVEIVNIKPKALRQVQVYDVEIMDNLIWLGTEFGVYIYDSYKDEGGFQAEAGGPMNEDVYALSVYGDQIWTGSDRSVEVYDYKEQKWLGGPERHLTAGLTVNYIEANEQVVWVATDAGVLKYDRERQRWRSFTMNDGLIGNYVTSIQSDGDYVWFGTPAGITRFYWNDPLRID